MRASRVFDAENSNSGTKWTGFVQSRGVKTHSCILGRIRTCRSQFSLQSVETQGWVTLDQVVKECDGTGWFRVRS